MKFSVENLLSHGILIARILGNCLWFSCAGISISIWFVVMYLAANTLVWVNVFLWFDILFISHFVAVLDLYDRVFWHYKTLWIYDVLETKTSSRGVVLKLSLENLSIRQELLKSGHGSLYSLPCFSLNLELIAVKAFKPRIIDVTHFFIILPNCTGTSTAQVWTHDPSPSPLPKV